MGRGTQEGSESDRDNHCLVMLKGLDEALPKLVELLKSDHWCRNYGRKRQFGMHDMDVYGNRVHSAIFRPI